MYVGNSWLVREDVSRVLCFCIMDRPRQIFARSQYVGALNDIADTYLKPVILHMLSIYQCILHHICIYIILCDSIGYAVKIVKSGDSLHPSISMKTTQEWFAGFKYPSVNKHHGYEHYHCSSVNHRFIGQIP